MKSLHLFIASALILALTGTASAQRRIYLLVGMRHIYRVEALPDIHAADRAQAEEAYAEAIEQAQQQFDSDMRSIAADEAADNGATHQDDRDAVQQNLEAAVADAADQRDSTLSQFYAQEDGIRDRHPELAVDQDGAYELVGVVAGPTGAFANFWFFMPYPGCLVPCPFGWEYGVEYPSVTLIASQRAAHSAWLEAGSPYFRGLYHAGVLIRVHAPIRRSVVLVRTDWVGGRPPAIHAGGTGNSRYFGDHPRTPERPSRPNRYGEPGRQDSSGSRSTGSRYDTAPAGNPGARDAASGRPNRYGASESTGGRANTRSSQPASSTGNRQANIRYAGSSSSKSGGSTAAANRSRSANVNRFNHGPAYSNRTQWNNGGNRTYAGGNGNGGAARMSNGGNRTYATGNGGGGSARENTSSQQNSQSGSSHHTESSSSTKKKGGGS